MFPSIEMSDDGMASPDSTEDMYRKYPSVQSEQQVESSVAVFADVSDIKEVIDSHPTSATKWFVNGHRHLILVKQASYHSPKELDFGEITNIRAKLDTYTQHTLLHVTCTVKNKKGERNKIRVWLFSDSFLPLMCAPEFSYIELDKAHETSKAMKEAG
jgi:hypothetical protein